MDCDDVNCPGRGPARAWMTLAHDDVLHKSRRQGILGPEVHARVGGRRSRTYPELVCEVDR